MKKIDAINAVVNDGMKLKELDSRSRNNKEVVLAAVKNNGLALKYASTSLKNDKEVVLTAVKNNIEALGSASMGVVVNNPEIGFYMKSYAEKYFPETVK